MIAAHALSREIVLWLSIAATFIYAREVNTKRSKTFTTCFFPVGDDIRTIVVEWVDFLRKEKLWGNDDPLFPATGVTAVGESRNSWFVFIITIDRQGPTQIQSGLQLILDEPFGSFQMRVHHIHHQCE